jgi:Na+/H+ antiporter NhaD/arsenite permease-like protein
MKKIELEKIIGYFLIVIAIGTLAYFAHFSQTQIISVVVFSAFVAGSLFYWPFRNAFALVGITFLLVLGVVDVTHLVEFAQLNIILFLIGMFTIIVFLDDKKFFDWLMPKIVKPFYNNPYAMIAILFLLATLMAALVDEVTSILFMSLLMIKILKVYKIEGSKVLPFIIFLVFTTNIGSSALPVGNPVGVLVAFQAGLTAVNFLESVFPIAIIASVVTTLIALLYLRSTIPSSSALAKMELTKLEDLPMNRDIKLCAVVFVATIAGLIVHAPIEVALKLPTDTLLLAVPLLMSGLVLFISRNNAPALIAKIDWWTLLYFTLLFASVGTLAYTGVTQNIANMIAHQTTSFIGAMLLLGGTISILTAFMDNVLAVATMAPVVKSLVASGFSAAPLWWIMLIGGTYCGNATVIGSTANMVAAGLVEKRGFGQFSMLKWMKIGVPVSILTFFLGFGLLLLGMHL